MTGRGVNQGVGDLSEVGVRDADHQAGQHRRMFGQRVLDLGRVDVAAADGEHVDPAVGQIQVALVVEPAQIAQGVPGPIRVRAGPCGAADIAVGGPTAGRRAHEDLPDHAGWALVAAVVEHLHLPGHHPSDRAAPTQPFGAADEGQRLKLGAAVKLPHHLGAEDVDPDFLDVRWARCGQMPPPPHRRQIIGIRIGAVDRQQSLHDGRHRRQIVDPVFGDQPEELARVEAAHQHQVLAGRQRHGGRGEAGVVAQRNRHQLGVGRQVAHHRRDQGAVEPAIAAGLDQLGPPGAAAGGHRLQRR